MIVVFNFHRGVLALDNALEIGVSPRYAGQPSAGAYMELAVGPWIDIEMLYCSHVDASTAHVYCTAHTTNRCAAEQYAPRSGTTARPPSA